MTTQNEIDRVMRIPGRVRGVVLATDRDYVLEQEGEDGLNRMEEQANKWGHPIAYSRLSGTDWFPLGLRAVSILAAQEMFGWGEKEIFAMGYAAPPHSFMVKILMRYFLSIRQTYQKSPEYWRSHYTAGELATPEFNEKDRFFVLRIEDFSVHPVLCPYYAGYFLRIAELASTYRGLRVEEKRCSDEEGGVHEYVIHWEKE